MIVLPLVRLAILLAGAGTVSIIVDRRLQSRKQRAATAGEATAAEEAPSMVDRLWSEVKGWPDRIMHRTPADFPPRFRAWAVQAAAEDTAVKDWLNALPDDGLQAFTEQLVAFCSDMGFALAWLVEQKFDKHPRLAQAAERIVVHYCRACQQAAVAQADLEVYKQILAFEQAPFSRKNRAFGEKLFAKVVEEDLVTAKISEYFLAPPKERQKLALAAIREAAAKDCAAFNRAVAEVIRGGATTAAP